MRATTLDELVQLPEPQALQRHFDDKSYRYFRFLLAMTAIGALGGVIASIDARQPVPLIVFALDLILCGTLFAIRRGRAFERSFRQILIAFLLVQILLLKYVSTHVPGHDKIVLFILPMYVLLPLRFRLVEHSVVQGALWVAGLFPSEWLGFGAKSSLTSDQIGPLTANFVLVLALAGWVSYREKRRFLPIWHREAGRFRERARLREEIDTARRIQLSMLPQGGPGVDWLDLAAVSMPAAEVGGDYYDSFRLDDDRVALVIADVAGHGVASGLLLSGVRSCLYLLEEDLGLPEGPQRVLERLHRMVQRTTERRMYVTLLCALLDRARGTVTVVSAGHPPLFHLRQKGSVPVELGNGAPPLGTRLTGPYTAAEAPLHSGDTFVLYSDGLLEARNALGADYGSERLSRVLGRAAGGPAVREVRDAVLADLSHFRGDEEQTDDLTLLVARVR
jgi:uncharacterized membrane protein YozB (DUF420 family)